MGRTEQADVYFLISAENMTCPSVFIPINLREISAAATCFGAARDPMSSAITVQYRLAAIFLRDSKGESTTTVDALLNVEDVEGNSANFSIVYHLQNQTIL